MRMVTKKGISWVLTVFRLKIELEQTEVI
jgi:hypothetical protein